MPWFTILSRIDAYVDYTCTVMAGSAEEAVDLAYEGLVDVTWAKQNVTEFDDRPHFRHRRRRQRRRRLHPW